MGMSTSHSEAIPGLDLRLLVAKTIGNLLKEEGVASGSSEQEKAERFGECIRRLETEKAKMEAFRKELPMSVHLVGDVIGWLEDEADQRRMPTRELFAPALAKRKVEDKAGAVMKPEVDANDKMDWMSSAQLWSCGNHSDTIDTSRAGSKGRGVKKPSHKVPSALNGSPTLAIASEKAGNATPPVLAELSLSSPAIDRACLVSPNANANCNAIDQARAQGQPAAQRKARRFWSAELHRQFVAVVQRLGGAQVATPKQIKELMNVDGLTNDEVKSHLQKYRLHTRRTAGRERDQPAIGLWPHHEQRRGASPDNTLHSSVSPEVHLQTRLGRASRGLAPRRLVCSSESSGRVVSVTAGDSYEANEENRRSENCSVETQHRTPS